MDEFLLSIIVGLNKQLSKRQLKADLKTLNDSMYVKVVAKLSTTLSKRQLKKDLKQLNDLYVKVGADLKVDKKLKNKLQSRIKELQNSIAEIEIKTKIAKTKLNADIDSVRKTAQARANRMPVSFELEVKKNKAIADIEYLGKRFSKLFSNVSAKQKYNNLLTSAYSISDVSQLRSVRTQISAFTSELKANDLAAKSLSDKWKALVNRSKDLFSAASIISVVFSQLRQSVSTFLKLDNAMTNLYKVQDQITSRDQFSGLLTKWNKLAQNLAVTTESLINSAAEWSKIGFDLDISQELAQITSIFEKTAEISNEKANSTLISIAQAFPKIDDFGEDDYVERVKAIGDKINKIGNEFAIDSEGVSDALQNSSAALRMANNDLDESIAIVTAANKIFQSPDEVGNMSKILSARLRGQRGELEKLNEDTDGLIESVSKIQTQILNLTHNKVNIFESDNETLKSTYDIVLEIGKIYDTLSDKNQADMLEIIAGKQRMSAVASLLINYKELEKVKNASMNADGSMAQEYDRYLESAEAHIITFREKLVETYSTFMSGDLIKYTADVGSGILDLVNSTDLLRHGILAVLALNLGKGVSAIGAGVASTVKQMNTLGNALEQVKNLPLDEGLRTGALENLGSATKGLTEKNLKLLLSQKQLDIQDKLNILSIHNLTEEEAIAKLQKMGLTTATNAQTVANTAETTSTFTLSGALNTLKTSVLGVGAAFKAAFVANPIGMTLTIATTTISVFSAIMSKQKQSIDNAKESLDEFNNTVTKSKNELETQRKWIEEHGARYEELAKGVDNYGHVISLTADEISEYNSLTKDIESMFPSMISGYNEQNQAIVRMKGSVDELTKSYEENVKAAYAATLAKAGENFDDYKTSTLLAKNQKKYIDEIVNGNAKLKNVGVIKSPFTDDGENGLQKDTKGIVTGIDTDILDESLIEQIKEETKDVEKTFDELSASLQQKIRATLISANSTIKTETAKVKPILEAYVYGNGGKDSGYDALDEESKQVIRNVISRLDDSFYENFDSDSDMAAHFYSYYIEPLKDGLQDSDLAVKINTLFAINQESYESYQDYVNAIIDIINQLKNYTDNNGKPLYSDEQLNALRSILGVSSTNNSGELSGQALIDTVKDKYSKVDGAEEYIKSLNEKELRVLYDLEPDKTESLESMKQTMDELEKEAKEEPKVKSDTPSFTNFTDAWKSLDKITDEKSPLKDLKENLLELAKSGELTEKTFKKTEGAKTWMKQMEETGLSVEDVIKKINNLVLSADQLASMKTGISSISNILGEKKENLSEKKTRNTGIGADTLAGMPEEVKKCTKAYNKFCNVLGNGESSMADCRKAANQLATAYVSSNNFLSNLTDGTKNYYISVLKEMGVENAEQIVTNELAKQKGLAAIKTADLTNMTYDEINALINEKGKTDEARNAMRLFALEKIYANGKGLDTTGDVEQLINLMEAFDIAVPAIQDYQNALKNYNPNEAMSDAVLEYYKNKAEKDYKNAIKKLKQKTKLTPPKIEVTPSDTLSKEKDKNKSKKDSAKETTQVIDWIERHIHNLQNTIDLTAAKLQNLFSVKAKNSNLDKQIKTTTKLIKAYGIAAEKYQKKADKVAKASSKTVEDDDGKKKKVKIKGLSKDILNKIKSGKLTKNTSLSSLIKTYGEDIAEKIQEYIDWYDKSQDAKKNKQEQITKKRELRQQKHQNIADKAQSQIDKLDAQKENVPVANAAKKNTLLKAQIKYIKQSYKEQIKIAKLEKDSVKAATLLAQKNAEILKIKKEILQNTLDKNEEKRTLFDAKYSNAKTTKEKNALIDDRIASYKSDKKAYENYYKDIKSGSGIKSAKSNVLSVLNVIPSKVSGLTKADKAKIKSLMKQGKKIPQGILKKVKHPTLLQRLKEYNAKADEVLDAKYTYELGKEQTDTAIRQEQIEKHQLRVDKAEGEYNLNQQLESNANTAKDKNKYESDSRKNLKEQYTHLIAIAKLNNDLTEAKRLQAEKEAKIAESYKKEFDNIKVWYELKTGRIDSEIGVTQAEVSALEAQGKIISGEFYDSMIKAGQNKKSELLAEKAELEKSLSNLTVGSPNWYDAKNALDSVSTALYECTQNTAEWQKTINELNMKPFENALSYLEAAESRIEFLINMLSHEILIDDDTGAFTSNGLTTMSLQLDEIANKEKQIANLRKEWSEYDFSNLSEEEIIAKNKDFQESIQSLIESTASLKDSIIDLCENALNTQLNALNDLISKYKDALNAEEDLYQYQKKVKEQTETIASLMKQQAALKGDESEETRARLQQIDVKLKEAQENLEETERQRTIDDINDMLDGLSEDFEDYITSALKDTDALIASVEQAIRENPDAIASALSDLGYGKSTDTNIKENPDGSKELTFSTSDGGFVTNKFDKDDNFIGSTVTDKNGSVVKTNDAKFADSATNNNNTSSETNTGISGGHSEGFNDKSAKIDTQIANLMYSGRTTTRLDGESNKINDYIKSKNGGMYITKQAWSQIKWLLKEKYQLDNVDKTPDNVIIETLKRAGFSQGGIVGSSDVDKVLASNGDDVLITAKVGEQILKPVDSENFIKLNNMLPNTVDVMENFVNAKPEMPHPELVRATEMNLGGVTIKLDGSNVVDFPTFKKDFENELRNDSSFKSMLGNAVTSMISGGHTNRMGRF